MAAVSHMGKIRQNNEDNFYVQGQIRQDTTQPQAEARYQGMDSPLLCAVADGMGGADLGELASLVVVQHLQPCRISQVPEVAGQCIQQANDIICDEIVQKNLRGMGSTLAALYIDGNQAVACNVGDSRVYRIHEAVLEQISVDHTHVQLMVSMGLLTKEQARNHRDRHALTQNIGIPPEEFAIEPAFSEAMQVITGDVFILCSDGLTDMVSDEQILEIASSGSAKEITRNLVQCALANGGHDNVTVIVITIK